MNDIQELTFRWPDYQRVVSKVLIIKGIVYCLWRLLTKDRVLKSWLLVFYLSRSLRLWLSDRLGKETIVGFGKITTVSLSLPRLAEVLSSVLGWTCRWRHPSVWCNPEGHTQHKHGRHPCTERSRQTDFRLRCVPHRRERGDTMLVDRDTPAWKSLSLILMLRR